MSKNRILRRWGGALTGRKATLMLFLMLFSALFSANANAQLPTEYQVKAALTYKFAKYIKWQDNYLVETKPIVFAVLGKNPFDNFFDSIAERNSIGGRKIEVRYFKTLEELEPVHVLFISSNFRDRLLQINKVLKGSSTVTILDSGIEGDSENVVVSFVKVRDKVRFKINERNAKLMKVELSKTLLDLEEK
jgi:hypothetical protein